MRRPSLQAIIEITAIRCIRAKSHEQISDVMWRTDTSQGQTSGQAIIDWLSANSDNHAVVAIGSVYVPVLVVRPLNQPAYLRAQIDGVWTDYLLSLPTF